MSVSALHKKTLDSSSYAREKTLRQAVFFEGKGVHSGEMCGLWVRPAPEETGIVFTQKGTDILVKADIHHVKSGKFSTTIGVEGWSLATVEHLLSALYGLGITNATVDVEYGREMPIFDGSAKIFADKIIEAGLQEQTQETQWIMLQSPVRVERDLCWLEAVPSGIPLLEASLTFGKETVQETCVYDMLHGNYVEDIASARTFSQWKDVEQMQKAGFIKGGTLECALVLHEDGVLNPEGKRFPNECARHKVLDMMGDFSLMGAFLYAHIRGQQSGHELNHQLMHKILDSKEIWEKKSFHELIGTEKEEK